MEITYHKKGNYLIPDLALPKAKHYNYKIGKYEYLRLDYIKNFKKAFYTELKVKNKLEEHLVEIDIRAKERERFLIKQLGGKENISKFSDGKDQIKWVGMKNNISNRMQEIILNEIIYK